MNLSGRAVAPILREFGIKPDRLVVIADELDLPVADLKYKAKGSAGGHNGHKSLIHSLGTEDYPRIKVGIGKGDDETIDHVLSRFPPEERVDINDAVKKAAEAVERTLNSGLDAAIAWLHTGRRS
jgi:peptidyl-tRNA hydrolase, PTH1 family